MIRSTPRWSAPIAAAALCGLLATGCEGDDEAERSTRPADAEEVVDSVGEDGSDDGSGDDGDPFTEECTLARQEIKDLLDPPDDYLEKQVTATPVDGFCKWSSNGYSTELMVRVKAYDDFYPDESTDKPIPGLGDEAWLSSHGVSVYWRRDSYSFNVDNASATDFTDRQLIDIARAVDADVPG